MAESLRVGAGDCSRAPTTRRGTALPSESAALDVSEQDRIRTFLEGESSQRLRVMLSAVDRSGWEPEAREIAREILAERGVDASAMDACPVCGGELEPGNVSVHNTLLSFLLLGFSYEHCWFRSARTRKKEVVVKRSDLLSACRCADCGTLMIAARPRARSSA